MKMRVNAPLVIALCCVAGVFALAADTGVQGTWNTDGVAVAEAAKKAGKSLSGLPEATQIAFKADTKKNKLTGTVFSVIDGKEFDIVDGKLNGTTFAFGTVPMTNIGFGNNNNNNNRGFGNTNNAAPKPLLWKGELKDENTISLQRVDESGNPLRVGDAVMGPLVLHRAKK